MKVDPSDTYQIIILLILLALSAFFSSNETALMSVNKIRLRSLADEGNKRAAMALDGEPDAQASQCDSHRKQHCEHFSFFPCNHTCIQLWRLYGQHRDGDSDGSDPDLR